MGGSELDVIELREKKMRLPQESTSWAKTGSTIPNPRLENGLLKRKSKVGVEGGDKKRSALCV